MTRSDSLMAADCTHDIKTETILMDMGEYGSQHPSDWAWCPRCGAVKRRDDTVWREPELVSRTHMTARFSCGCKFSQDGINAEPQLLYCARHGSA